MVWARNSDSETPLKKWNSTPGTDFRLKSLSDIFLMHPVSSEDMILSLIARSLKINLNHTWHGERSICLAECYSSWIHVKLIISSILKALIQSHFGFICLMFILCVFSNVSSNGQPERMHSHSGFICLMFLASQDAIEVMSVTHSLTGP